MKQSERYQGILQYYLENHPVVETELHYENPFQLLVAVILSAQCTDKRINIVTPALFQRFPSPIELASATFDEVFALIKSVSYPNNKSKHLIGMAQTLLSKFQGEIPATVDELTQLPGVGRKTANVIASVVFNLPTMAVDTHVFRVSARLGLTRGAKNPLQAEQQLVKHIPNELIPRAHHWLILHGRYTCLARSPKCTTCAIQTWCLYYEKNFLKKSENRNTTSLVK